MLVALDVDVVPEFVAALSRASASARQLDDEAVRLAAAGELAVAGPSPLAAWLETMSIEVDQRRTTALAHRLWASTGCPAVLDTDLTYWTCDGAGDGRAVVVIGDLAEASSIAVLVPGVGTTLSGLNDELERARNLAAAAGPATAVIVWADYDAPGWIGSPSMAAASAAAPALAEFLDRLPSGPRLTVIGHSYGSLVAATALADGGSADALVVLGSPGLGVDRATELVGAGEVYAVRAPGDLIGALGAFGGVDPALPSFGATRLDADDTRGHSSYLDVGTDALANVAAVVSGNVPDLVVHRTTLADAVADAVAVVVNGVDDQITDMRDEFDLPGWADAALAGIQRAGSGAGGLLGHGAGALADSVTALPWFG